MRTTARSDIFKVVLLLETSRQYGRQLLRGIANYARQHGPWALVVSPGHFEQELPRVRQWGPDAAIVRISSPQMAHAIHESGIPAVALEATLEEQANLNASLGIPEIRPDSAGIAQAAADHLMERGFRHFAFCGLSNAIWSRARQEAFCRRLAERGFTCHTRAAATGFEKSNSQRDRAALADWLKQLPKPVGLMACNDDLAARTLNACLLARLPVPDEVAVIGVDDDELVCELSDPPLSSVALDLEHAGYEAAELLDNLRLNRATGDRQVLVKALRVVARRSTDVIAQDDRMVAAAMRFIQDNAPQPINVADVVEHVGLSRRSLERRFFAATKQTLLEQLTRCRVDRAKRLLAETKLSIERIASAAGFAAPKRMARAFRECEGMLPHVYRHKHQPA